MRLAGLILNNQVNAIYRSLIPMEALAQRGHEVWVSDLDSRPPLDRFLQYDAVLFWRCYWEHEQRFALKLKRAGIPLLWDNDDDISSIPRDNPAYQKTGGLRGRRAAADMARMMRAADVVTTPSAVLAERYREMSGADVRVIDNYLRPNFAQPRGVPRATVTIGWLAALEHRMDYERLGLRAVFERLLQEFEHVHVTSIGLKLLIDHPRCHHVPITPYEQLPRALTRFDVGIAPLADIAFNRARSSVKLKEYAACGIPWLASPTGPYAELGPPQGGMLVADDGWYERLAQIVEDPERRERLAHQGKAWAQRETIVYHVDEWERAVHDAYRRARDARALA